MKYLKWQNIKEIFGDTVMTAAMIEWLIHKSYLLNMNGGSYRLKETKEWLAKQEEEKDELNWLIFLQLVVHFSVEIYTIMILRRVCSRKG